MELRPIKARRERELDERISEIANTATLAALEMSAEASLPFRIQIPPQPDHLSPRSYLERVQDNVAKTLAALGCERMLECNAEMTELVNADLITGHVSRSIFTRYYRNDLPLIVFQQPEFTGASEAASSLN